MHVALEAPFDPFKSLGLERNATPKSIKARYHELARRYHPNRYQGLNESKIALSEHFHSINQAWQHLCKADRRRRCVELLDLFDLYESTLANVADLLDPVNAHEHVKDHVQNSPEGHVSSDADDDDLPGIPGVRRRTTFDNPAISNGVDAVGGRHSSASGSQAEPLRRSNKLRFRPTSNMGKEETGSDSNHAVALERRRKFDRLRRKELEAFYRYRDAMMEKFEAEERAERLRAEYEQAKWRREYYGRAPKEVSQRVKFVKVINTAVKMLSQPQPLRRRSTTLTASYGSPIVPNGESELLGPPSRSKTMHRRVWSNDISGDQTSSDDNSSDIGTSPTGSPRPSSPRPSYARHRRWDSGPSVLTVPSLIPSLIPNGNHDPISPINGPGPKVFIRAPTTLHETFDIQGSDADSASASSRSPSPHPADRDSSRFALVPSPRTSDLFGGSQSRRSRSPSTERRAPRADGTAPGLQQNPSPDCDFMIRQVGQLVHRNIQVERVHEITSEEKQWILGVQADTDMNPTVLIDRVSRLDRTVGSRFVVKPDIKAKFAFRLIYDHREVVKEQHHTFIALSYRRKKHVQKRHGHYSLPLEEDMFQAVWEERQHDEGVWIDQICIDGDSQEEKTISMSAMDMVYRSARLVVVVLDDISLEAHEGSILSSHMDEFQRLAHVPPNKRFRRRPTPYLESHSDLSSVIQKMMTSSWFRRAWCRHEMRLAREHIFLIPCKSPGSWSSRSVIRLTGSCLTHLLGLATEVPFDATIEALKPSLYAFFRDRNKLPAHEHHLRLHHGNFTTVVAEVFAMEAGGDPAIPAEQREADARKDKISIILNTMEVGLALDQEVRNTAISLPPSECHYMLLLLALAARDPGALCSVGRPVPLAHLPIKISSSWLLEPTNVDSGLNNYRTLNRLPDHARIITSIQDSEHFVQLDLKFLHPGLVSRPTDSPATLKLARRFIEVCEQKKLGRNRQRYLIKDKTAINLFGSMQDVYAETLACVFELGPDWLSDVSHRYGVSRWKSDLHSAYGLLIALKNTHGGWPENAWGMQAAGFIMDFVNFLIIRGMPRRHITEKEKWRPVWVLPAIGGRVLTFAPPGNIRAVVPVAVLDQDYVHLARLWLLEPRGATSLDSNSWTLVGKSVLFSDNTAIDHMEERTEDIRERQRVFGRLIQPDFESQNGAHV